MSETLERPASDAKAAGAKSSRKVRDGEMQPAEYIRQDMIVRPEVGTTLEEMLAPEYWAHVAKRLKVYDRIEVRGAYGEWWAELLVRVVEDFSVVVHVLRVERFGADVPGEESAIPDGFKIYGRGRAGWIVKRLADNLDISEGHKSREFAAAWLRDHVKRLQVAA